MKSVPSSRDQTNLPRGDIHLGVMPRPSAPFILHLEKKKKHKKKTVKMDANSACRDPHHIIRRILYTSLNTPGVVVAVVRTYTHSSITKNDRPESSRDPYHNVALML